MNRLIFNILMNLNYTDKNGVNLIPIIIIPSSLVNKTDKILVYFWENRSETRFDGTLSHNIMLFLDV